MKKKAVVKKKSVGSTVGNSNKVDAKIKSIKDWRGATVAHMRALIKQVIPDVVEDLKWAGVPVWYSNGMICTGETYNLVVKLTFANGAKLKGPKKLFNSSLKGGTRRAIDIKEGEKVNEVAFKALIKEAVAFNKNKGQK